ncbi:MAG TPA: DoxX family membrane protein [Tepidisphaeraceae bacterium]|nr:DoxX family membrane protein [Tepidisphaeraceae bacterium]
MSGQEPNPPPVYSAAHVLGYAALRLAIGMSMLIHGLERLPKTAAFVAATEKQFAGSPLPPTLVAAFAHVTPPVETLIGILVFFGIATSTGLILGGLWMVALIFGATLIEQYQVVGVQLLYSLIFFVLLQYLPQNRMSVDWLVRRHIKGTAR